MPMWQDILKTLGVQGMFLAAAAWLIKTLLLNRFARDADQFKAQLKTSADVEIERLKNSLQMAALEHQVRFSKLHERRAEVIADLYKRLFEVPRTAAGFIYVGNRDPELEVKAREQVLELYCFIQIHRIYLPSSICGLLDNFQAKLSKSVIFVGTYWTKISTPNPETLQQQNEVMAAACNALETEIPALRQQLEEEFRALLGGGK